MTPAIDMINKLKFDLGHHLPSILQTEGSECGLACLAMVATYHGYSTSLPELRKSHPVSLKGATLEDICQIAEKIGLVPRGLRLDLDELGQLECPAILHWNLNHFVVLKKVQGRTVVILDPGSGEVHLTLDEVSEQFTGVALELSPGFEFQRKTPPPPLKLSQIVGRVAGLKRSLVQLFMLALALEAIALFTPVLTQWITDEAIVSADRDLMTTLGLSAITLAVAMVMITAVRAWVALYIGTHFNLQWMANVMSHLLKLPVDFFERRHLGDIVSRFGSVSTITHTLTGATVEVALDGLLAVGTFTMMLVYNGFMALVPLATVALYALFRWLRYNAVRMASSGALAKHAKEQTYFLETLRGVRSIKLVNRESERRSAWLTLWVDATNAGLKVERMNLVFGTVWGLMSSIERAAVLWMGALFVMDHKMSLGMMLAFLAYKEQFVGRISTLVERIVDIKMLSVSSERLADIVMSVPEESASHRAASPVTDLTLTLDKVTYRYSVNEVAILSAASLTIKPGECVAIVGASGAGKTTCLKVLMGILKPTGGKVLIGGVPLSKLGLHAYRNIVAAVMQDDHLFAGSMFDNICLLDPKPDEAWAHECARVAQVHDEIVAMPMGYFTLVGDMGTVLSGGQKQRILLARALYRRPKILVLDEATSHLDIQNESRIGEAIAALNITRIIIAHRPQTISIADRIIRLERGRLTEVTRSYPQKPSAPELEPAVDRLTAA